MTTLFLKDPDAVLDFQWDWSDWLATGETISSYEVTVADGITLDSDSNTDSTVTVWLSGGTDGEVYSLLCHIVTSSAREDDRTMRVRVKER